MSTGKLLLDLSNELLRNGQSVRFSAPGRSMYPTIREGEPITVQPVSPSAVQKGDIILYLKDVVEQVLVTFRPDLLFVVTGVERCNYPDLVT